MSLNIVYLWKDRKRYFGLPWSFTRYMLSEDRLFISVGFLNIKDDETMQLPSPTPSFAFFVNLPQYVRDHYRRFLENKIRENWDFSGIPMQIFFRQK